MIRARTFPASATFAAMATNLATQLADFECAGDSDTEGKPFFDKWCETEKALTSAPAHTVGDILLKIEVLCKIAEHSIVTADEWQTLARDVRALNGPSMAFEPNAWLRRWTNRGGGYVRTDSGVSFVTTEATSMQHRLLLDELHRAEGHQAVAEVINGEVL